MRGSKREEIHVYIQPIHFIGTAETSNSSVRQLYSNKNYFLNVYIHICLLFPCLIMPSISKNLLPANLVPAL